MVLLIPYLRTRHLRFKTLNSMCQILELVPSALKDTSFGQEVQKWKFLVLGGAREDEALTAV